MNSRGAKKFNCLQRSMRLGGITPRRWIDDTNNGLEMFAEVCLVPEGLEPTQGFPYRILSLVADATKVRRVCKPSESQASMALVINAIGAIAFRRTDKRRTTTVSSWRWSRGYLITLSARDSTDCGIVRPICLAVCRLMTRSILSTACTGKSLGLTPLRTRWTYFAERRPSS